jgi:hypothetical protein
MPGLWHDSGNELFKDDPDFAGRLARLAGAGLPPGARLAPAPTNETDRMLSSDLDPDTVLVAGLAKRPDRVIIVELQQAWDPGKLRQWPRYAASKWLRYECPVDLLVICPDDATAGRYAGPITTSLDGYTHRPTVVTPALVPALASAGQAMNDPAMGVMSVAYHGASPGVADAFAAGILSLPPGEAKKYYEYGLRMSPEGVREALEQLMATKYNEPFSKLGLRYYGQGREEGLETGMEAGREQGLEQGLVAGERGTVLMVLKARSLQVSDSQRARIDACDDLATLREWAEAALTAPTADDLFK